MDTLKEKSNLSHAAIAAEKASKKVSTVDALIEKAEKEEGVDTTEIKIDYDKIIPHIKNDIERKVEKIGDEINNLFMRTLTDAQEDIKKQTEADIAAIRREVEDAVNTLKTYKTVKIINTSGETKEVTGFQHNRFFDLLRIVNAGLLPFVVGMAGTGKTHVAEQIAEAMERPFYGMSVGAQTTMSQLLGYMNASGDYVKTDFRRAYEDGGIFLLDEIDAGNANVLVCLNAALAGNWCSFADGMVRRHENFTCIAAANTYGTGATRQYMGRNQLDAATLDRFVMFDFPIDEELERHIIIPYENGPRWHRAVVAARRLVEKENWLVVVSPRATMKGAKLLDAGFTVEEVIYMTLTSSLDKPKTEAITKEVLTKWAEGDTLPVVTNPFV